MTTLEQELDELPQLEILTELNAQDLVTAFKLDRFTRARPLIDALASIPARRFSKQLIEFDRRVGEAGLSAGGRYMLDLFCRQFTVYGGEHIPATGPALIVANHPGMVDVMALWAALERRPDLRIVAAERQLLRALPNVSRNLIFVPEHSGARTGLLRTLANFLRRGGALLTFPAGKIEPDPTIRMGAIESLESWASSTALLVRLAPEAQIIPAAVGGVISPRASNNIIARQFREQKERDWAAAALQVLVPAYRNTHARVAFGAPLRAADLNELGEPEAVVRAVAAQVAPLLAKIQATAC